MQILKLVVYVDCQNAYKGARETFFDWRSPSMNGQFDPMLLGQLLASRGGPGGRGVNLQEVRVYTGRPDATRDPKTYAAHMRQCHRWEQNGVVVNPHQLRYPRDWPATRAQEKGVDVSLALDFVAGAIDETYDLGIIMSTDTDLIPALSFVLDRYPGSRFVATAAWRSQYSRRRLAIQSSNVWCNWLGREDYDQVADPTDYNV